MYFMVAVDMVAEKTGIPPCYSCFVTYLFVTVLMFNQDTKQKSSIQVVALVFRRIKSSRQLLKKVRLKGELQRRESRADQTRKKGSCLAQRDIGGTGTQIENHAQQACREVARMERSRRPCRGRACDNARPDYTICYCLYQYWYCRVRVFVRS
jgi:hypothetical protein